MKTKIQIKSTFGKLLFEYEKENNTIKDTLLEAIESNADLRYADLSNADLSNANLSYADLSYADLRNANLRNADLRDASLRGANLSNTILRDANLRNVNLRNADLRGANLPIFCKWSYGIKGDKIVIGCIQKTIEDWDLFFNSKEEYSTKRNTDEFKQIEAVYNALKYYLLTLGV